MSEAGASADQHQKPSHPNIVESDGKWIPRIYFLRHKYEHGRFDSQDEAVLAYNTITSRVQAVLTGKDPNLHGDSKAASGDYFESVEWRIQVFEEEMVRLRQSEASTVTRLSLADTRMRAADEKHKRDLGQIRDELQAAQNTGDQTKQELDQVKAKLRVVRGGRDRAQTDLDKVRGQLSDIEKERDQVKDKLRVAQAELGQVKSQVRRSDGVQAVEKERDQARTDLNKVKVQLGTVEKERDHAHIDLAKVKVQLGTVEKERDHAQTDLAKVKVQLCTVQKERDHAQTDLAKVKVQLCTVQKERDQARADSNKVRSVLCTTQKEAAENHDTMQKQLKGAESGGSKMQRDLGGKTHEEDTGTTQQRSNSVLGTFAYKQEVQERDPVKIEPGAKRTYSEMQATSHQTARLKVMETELESAREKNVKLQLALDIKTNELEKELKRRRQCHCVQEIVEILD